MDQEPRRARAAETEGSLVKKLVITLNLRDNNDVEELRWRVEKLLLVVAEVLGLPEENLDRDPLSLRDVLGNVVGRVEVS